MYQISTVAAREHFAEIINRVKYGVERIILTRRDQPVAALVSLEDLKRLEGLDKEKGENKENTL